MDLIFAGEYFLNLPVMLIYNAFFGGVGVNSDQI